jgi:endonuclease/exonuclease/phosphatase family metal-dependent hydrolase
MKLITWNVQWCLGCDGLVSPARIVSTAHAMADFDVLCLQEVANNYPELAGSAGENQFDTLKSLLPNYIVVEGVATNVRAPDGRLREFGNVIITRLPVLQIYRHLLPWPADPAVPSMQRGALEVVLQSPSGPVRVTTAHLEYYSARQREAQVERLRELQIEAAGHAGPQAKAEPKGGPFDPMPRPVSGILTGDFNFRPEDALHARMQAPLAAEVPPYRDAWEVRHPGIAHAATLGLCDKQQWPDDPFCCDFIYVTEDLTGRVEDVSVNQSTDASDHQPVMLVLRD